MTLQTIIADLRATGMLDREIAAQLNCSISAISMWGCGHRAVKNGDYMLKLFRLHQDRCTKTRKQKLAA